MNDNVRAMTEDLERLAETSQLEKATIAARRSIRAPVVLAPACLDDDVGEDEQHSTRDERRRKGVGRRDELIAEDARACGDEAVHKRSSTEDRGEV